MKFAHLSDCHIGSWREPGLRDASTTAFCKAIDMAISRQVDFIIISGDLFNTAQPGMEYLRATVEKLKLCQDCKVPVYLVAGSHDFSPSGKTMLDVLDAAGLCKNVARGREIDGRLRLEFTKDPKTGAKITGMVGRKGSLERHYFECLDLESLEKESGQKIFVFHSAVMELRPKGFEEVESVPLSYFPKGFSYYAGGHIHIVDQQKVEGYGLFGIPGPIFPNNFQELEKLKNGGFYIYGDVYKDDHYSNANHSDPALEFIPVCLHPVHSIHIEAHGKTPSQVEEAIQTEVDGISASSIVTLRVEGILDQGKVSDIPWNTLTALFLAKGAHCVLRNTAKLSTTELSPIQVSTSSVEEIEHQLICEHAGQLRVFDKDQEKGIIKGLMQSLGTEKGEAETATSFEQRLIEACRAVIFGDLNPPSPKPLS